MNSFAKLAMAAAAVVVVAIVGYSLLPSGGDVGGPIAPPAPSISPSPSAPAPESPMPSDAAPSGPLQPGTYTYYGIDTTDVNVRFTVPAGWQWDGEILRKPGPFPPDGVVIAIWSDAAQVYTDPCQWEGAEPDPPTGPTARELVDALAAQPTRNASTPTERKAAGLAGPDRWTGWTVETTVPEDIDFSTCSRGEFRTWGPDGDARYHQGPGQRDKAWAIDIDADTRIIVVVASYPASPDATMTETDAILDSMVFGHWG